MQGGLAKQVKAHLDNRTEHWVSIMQVVVETVGSGHSSAAFL
jgi:hypothetical protein